MHRTVATPEGGVHVELTAEEEAATREEWARNEALRAALEAIDAAEKAIPSTQEIADLILEMSISTDALFVAEKKSQLAEIKLKKDALEKMKAEIIA